MAEKKSKAPLHGKENVKRRGAKSAADASSGQHGIKPPTYLGWEEYAADERRKADATVAARKRTVGLVIAAASAVALYRIRRVSTSQGRTNNAEARGTVARNKDQTPKEAFLRWFVDNGGTYHPIGLGDGGDGDATTNVTIEEFPSYGGWGLALTIPERVASSSSNPPPDECRSDDVHGQCAAAESPPVIRRLDPLFTVPSSIIITVQSVIETYSSHASPLHLPDFRRAVNGILDRSVPNGQGLSSRGMGLGQQDAIIAAYLMAEDCQHRHPDLFDLGDGGGSFWGGYLDVLPGGLIPRLDTFGDEDYAALRDEGLEQAGRESLWLLRTMFGGDEVGDGDGDGGGLRTVVRDMIRRKIGMSSSLTTTTTTTTTLPHDTTTIVPDSCISFEAFHRFVGIVSSRAMVLRGVKQ